ncbi:hypothetical protein CTM97_21140 [Photobacterium phosphoreum]|uniref:Uncharacterized protein n=1 Tax=Photobacterium phosphoreum TaxID=659 RepID=A0A2T3JTD7_PHOPO|nr:hypothetical protein [Photobacterium phosphoreum]PSU19199.1 hypothetical protein CTM96_21510 [Photobacterium phosphoreum]PSU36892.1 hypothetical protein CTM97_21140 [Photobacterium phosphoreum]PSU52433.1 hypothetical protein C9J18_09850 [Photobacterium phosphoreum]
MQSTITIVTFFILFILPMAAVFLAGRYIWNKLTVSVPVDFDAKKMTVKFERHFSPEMIIQLPYALRDDLLAIFAFIKRIVNKYLPKTFDVQTCDTNTCDAEFETKAKVKSNIGSEQVKILAKEKTTTQTTQQETDQELPKATKFASGDFG